FRTRARPPSSPFPPGEARRPSRRIPTRLRASRSRGSSLARLQGPEVARPRSADGAEPVLGDVLEARAGRDPAVGVADRGVVDEPTALADPEGRLGGRGHRRKLRAQALPKSTATGSRCEASSISKYSRAVKPPWPAMTEPGNCWISVL